MTMDDNNSVYVGGLPYDITEEALRRVFSPYGTVHDIKVNFISSPSLLLLQVPKFRFLICLDEYVQIVNDQSVRGKCYGFVTFSNRRSADDAIQDMDGNVCFFLKIFIVVQNKNKV